MSKKVESEKKAQRGESEEFVSAVVNGKNEKAGRKLERILAKKIARRIRETLT